jgi:hypothetical protein
MRTREEHLAWCKEDAMKLVDTGDFQGAVTAMLCDLDKHPDTAAAAQGVLAELGVMLLLKGPTREEITSYIQGFN